jgi:protein arginine N-methyltransferase 1
MLVEHVRLPRARQLAAVADVAEPAVDTAFWPTTGEYPIYDAMAYYFMTHDVERVRRYESAIAHLARGRTAVDIGTGQDVNWAHRCVTRGATTAFAIEEMDETIAKARAYVSAHRLESSISLLLAVELPERVDLCVSEIIGTIGSSEGVVVSLLDAHRRFLKPGGAMIPFRCATRVAATTLPEPLASAPAFSREAINYIDEVFAAVGTKFDLRIAVENYSRELLLSDAAAYEDLRFDSAAALAEAIAR